MNCADCEVLVHALIDGELDAGHAIDVERHLASCAACAEKLNAFDAMRTSMARAKLKETAPAALRARIEAGLPKPAVRTVASQRFLQPSRRSFFGGLGAGVALSAAMAAGLLMVVFNNERDEAIANGVVSAHLRSLQPGHLTDVETSDQHTVKPWFNGKLDAAPPVVDLTSQGFTLVGGRLDDINSDTAAAIVYRRRQHIINLFVTRQSGAAHKDIVGEIRHGFNLRHWAEDGLEFWAVSDINAAELDEFCQKFTSALHS